VWTGLKVNITNYSRTNFIPDNLKRSRTNFGESFKMRHIL